MNKSRLTKIEYRYKDNNYRNYNLYQCDCGNQKIIRQDLVNSKRIKSCGCLSKELKLKHGKYNTQVYRAWDSMKQRCFNIKNCNYKNYGHRGITVCKRWKDSFEEFLKDMGEPKKGQSLDRIDNQKDYCPENCRWVSNKTQSRNRRTNKLLTFNNKTMCIADWADKIGISRKTIEQRLKRGWSTEEAKSLLRKNGIL